MEDAMTRRLGDTVMRYEAPEYLLHWRYHYLPEVQSTGIFVALEISTPA